MIDLVKGTAGGEDVQGHDLDTRLERQEVATVAEPTWYVYLVRAANGALYCGITLDTARRFREHQSGRGARFFHSSPAQALVYRESCPGKGAALRRELAIKRYSKRRKESLVQGYAASIHAQDKESS